MSHDGAAGDVLIRGATVVDTGSQAERVADVRIEGGFVREIAPGLEPRAGEPTIDAAGLHAVPAFIDLHAHFREPGDSSAETIETGAAAAARGGYATVCVMPNTDPVIDDASLVRFIQARAAQACGVRVLPIAAVTRGCWGEELTDFATLLESGAVAFSDAQRPVQNAATLRRALENARDLGTVVVQQCADADLAGSGVMHEGAVSMRLGLHGVPRLAEATMVARDSALALATGGRLHVGQVSNAESVDVLRHYKSRGAPVTAEVSPHHLTMTDAAVATGDLGFNTNAKVLPPLCAESDRRALVEALEDGTIDCVATAHAPHTSSKKRTVFDAAPPGVTGLESAFAVLYTQFVRTGRWSLAFLLDALAAGPARVLRGVVAEGAGGLRVGGPGDVALVRLDEPSALDPDAFASKSRNCPWAGETMFAQVRATIVGGRLVYRADRQSQGVIGDGASREVVA